MMKVVICAGPNHEEASLYLVAKQIQQRIPDSVIIKGPSDKALLHADLVINIDITCTAALEKASRYMHYGKMICLLAGDLEENKLPAQLEMVGQAFKYPLVLHSHHSFNVVTAFAKEWFAPAKARKVLPNLVRVLYGVEEAFQLTEKNDKTKFIVPYNRINQSEKNISLHKEVSASVATTLLAMDKIEIDHMFIVGENILNQTATKEKYPEYRFESQSPSRDVFRSMIEDRGMFISTSLFESFGIYFVELLCSGVVGVFLDKPWIRSLLPDYPYLYPASELATGVVNVFRNYEEAQSRLQKEVIPFIRKTYSLDKFVAGLIEI